MLLWIILAVVAAAVIYAIVVFNGPVRTRQMANEAWSGIDVQLKRRSDLVPIWLTPSKATPRTSAGCCRR